MFIFRCLSESSFICRSATYDTTGLFCHLSRFTIKTNPDDAEKHEEYDYLENECLLGNKNVGQIADCSVHLLHLLFVWGVGDN